MSVRIVITLALTLLVALPATAQDYQKGRAALKRHDYSTAFRHFLPLAKGGNVKAQMLLGAMYYRGRGIPKNFTEAAKWFREAGKKGHMKAQYFLGFMYQKGQGVPRNYAEAAKWYLRAARKGFAKAQYNLGYMYNYGLGVRSNYSEAMRWSRLAADKGNSSAQYLLALIIWQQSYKSGILAYKWASLAARAGHRKALKLKNKIEPYLSAAQRREGQRLIREWKPKR